LASCISRFPGKGTFPQGNSKRKLFNLARTDVRNDEKHFPESVETKKGHMKGPRQGIKSTKVDPLANVALDGT
jgi:hypothetical protein